MLCTDGISDKFSPDKLAEYMMESPTRFIEIVTSEIKKRSKDNATAIMVELIPEDEKKDLRSYIKDKAKEYQLDTNELNIGMIHKCKLSCDYPGLFAISIKINGEVMPCGCLQNKIFSIGNIYTDSLNKILHISNKRIALVKKMIDTRKALFQENYYP